MWRLLACGGTLVHAAVGTFSILSASPAAGPAELMLIGATTLLPSAFGLAAVIMAGMLHNPPEVLRLHPAS
jgi:hypothetical protein